MPRQARNNARQGITPPPAPQSALNPRPRPMVVQSVSIAQYAGSPPIWSGAARGPIHQEGRLRGHRGYGLRTFPGLTSATAGEGQLRHAGAGRGHHREREKVNCRGAACASPGQPRCVGQFAFAADVRPSSATLLLAMRSGHVPSKRRQVGHSDFLMIVFRDKPAPN